MGPVAENLASRVELATAENLATGVAAVGAAMENLAMQVRVEEGAVVVVEGLATEAAAAAVDLAMEVVTMVEGLAVEVVVTVEAVVALDGSEADVGLAGAAATAAGMAATEMVVAASGAEEAALVA
eukprot:361007-Chlamydomonas_euryale.AAC.1